MRTILSLFGFTVTSLALLCSCSNDKATEPVQPKAPTVLTATTSSITQTTAACGGTITSDGGAPVTSRGVCWSTTATPTTADNKTTDGTGIGSFTSALTGLTAGTTYYVRAYAINSAGTGYGGDEPFTTDPEVPIVSTAIISSITQTTAEGGGTITLDGGAAVTSRGVCWSTTASPTTADNKTTDGSGTGDFTSTLTGLTAGTIYYVRAYATNSAGTGYGSDESFMTVPISYTVTDIDGNVYQTVIIGTQEWMAENLKVTHYRNGDTIDYVTDGLVWDAMTSGAYCNYDHSEDTAAVYGRLYNWYAINDARGIAPAGWHLPTETEWQTLVWFLGTDAGGQLKETGTAHWISPNQGATNESGFTALPAGMRGYQGLFISMGQDTWFWASTEFNASRAYSRGLSAFNTNVSYGNLGKYSGLSIRCVKD